MQKKYISNVFGFTTLTALAVQRQMKQNIKQKREAWP